MKLKLFLLSMVLVLHIPGIMIGQQSAVQENVNGIWTIIPEKSRFEFKIQAMHVFNVKGAFTGVTGSVEIKQNFYGVKVDLTVDPSTVDTGNDKRDDHLRHDDFFDVELYPDITFTADKITSLAGEQKYMVEGQLTIKDVSLQIKVPVVCEGLNKDDQIVFTGSKNINRREYNVNYTGRGVGDVAELDFIIVASRAD